MWLLFVVLLLQVFEELPLKLVNIFDVAENGLQLQLGEHVRVFAALADVTLKENRMTGSDTGQQGALVWCRNSPEPVEFTYITDVL